MKKDTRAEALNLAEGIDTNVDAVCSSIENDYQKVMGVDTTEEMEDELSTLILTTRQLRAATRHMRTSIIQYEKTKIIMSHIRFVRMWAEVVRVGIGGVDEFNPKMVCTILNQLNTINIDLKKLAGLMKEVKDWTTRERILTHAAVIKVAVHEMYAYLEKESVQLDPEFFKSVRDIHLAAEKIMEYQTK